MAKTDWVNGDELTATAMNSLGAEVNAKAAQGEKGDKGDTGETGPQGPAGADGADLSDELAALTTRVEALEG